MMRLPFFHPTARIQIYPDLFTEKEKEKHMKLTFLGTSHGVPAADRFCSCAMLEVNGAHYLIDCGAPAAELLIRRGIPYTALRAIFTTHAHGDHTNGLLHLCDLSNWKFKDASYDVFLTEQALADALKTMIAIQDTVLDEQRIRLHVIGAGPVYSDENLSVTAVPTRHMEHAGRPSYSYIIECEGKRLIFTGDLHGQDAADFPAAAKVEPSDLIVCEMAHFSHEVAFSHLKDCPTKRVFFNHVWYNYEQSMAGIEAAKGRYPFEVLAVADNDEFIL